MIMKNMLIAGANGFLARNISAYFSECGWTVSGLARHKEGLHSSCQFIPWDGVSIGDWVSVIEECDVLINMVGRSINCRHNKENKRQILNSRIQSTKLLADAVAKSVNPPSLWINGSATGIYKNSYTMPYNESGEQGDGFIADVVKQWEAAFFQADIPESVRRVALRTSVVLADTEGNPYRYLYTLARFGLGGKVGNGKQMVSWVHLDDVARVVEHIINHHDLDGPINMATSDALSNAEMMRRFRKHLGMPIGLPAPALAVRLGTFILGTAPELVLDSCWAAPEKLLASGFVFKKPTLELDKWNE